MSVLDLVALVAVISSIGTLLVAGARVFRGRRAKALDVLRVWAMCAVMYLLISVIVSFLRPQRVLALGDPWCLDDWCLQVQSVDRLAATYQVKFRVYSTARRISQHAPEGSELFLIDDQQHRYPPSPDAFAPLITVALGPEESVEIQRVFAVPADARVVGLTQTHGGSFCGMDSLLIIGQGGCLFNKPTVIRFPGVE